MVYLHALNKAISLKKKKKKVNSNSPVENIQDKIRTLAKNTEVFERKKKLAENKNSAVAVRISAN